MPTSHCSQISTIVEIILAAKPQSVLDIGIGFGKYGFLCREYLELWDGRQQYGKWQHRIDGIEAFAAYVTPLQRLIYDNIYTGDARRIVPELRHTYDLILLIDVIEHFTIDEGRALLMACAERGKACLISTPLEATQQGSAFGNAYEVHHSQWSKRHFADLGKAVFVPNPTSLLCYLPSAPAPVRTVAACA
jgi:hypothetical protein